MLASDCTATQLPPIFLGGAWRSLVDGTMRDILRTSKASPLLLEHAFYHLGSPTELPHSTTSHSKKLRSFLLLCFANCLHRPTALALSCAAAMELLHHSTLIIDDIQDGSSRRHDRPALWKVVGMPSAINVACYFAFLSQSTLLGLASAIKHPEDLAQRLATGLGRLYSGQHADLNQPRLRTFGEYELMVAGKSGELIALSCEIGASLAPSGTAIHKAIREFCQRLTAIHQINDDLDDLTAIDSNWADVPSSNVIWCFSDNDISLNEARFRVIGKLIEFQNELRASLVNIATANAAEAAALSPVILNLVGRHLVKS